MGKFLLISRNPLWSWRVVQLHNKCTTPPYGMPELYELKKSFIQKKYKHIFDHYSAQSTIDHTNDGPIWTCWWQGEANMLPIVKGCYARLREMAPENHPIILITKDNFRNYVDIPDFIIEKLENKRITITQFSDILRFYLLSAHGGMWIDATTWVNHPISLDIFNRSFYTCRSTDPDILDTKRVARGLDTPWLLACCKNSPILSICRDIFTEYWKEYNYSYDYLFIDYCLILIYDNMPELKKEMDKGGDVQNHLFDMEPLFNQPFHPERFDEISHKSPFFKLSYKMNSVTHTENGDLTYFGYFCQYGQAQQNSPAPSVQHQ